MQIARNYILVANENLIQVKRENKLGASIEDTGRKIMQIKETIEKEKQRIYSIEQKIAAAKKVQRMNWKILIYSPGHFLKLTHKEKRY